MERRWSKQDNLSSNSTQFYWSGSNLVGENNNGTLRRYILAGLTPVAFVENGETYHYLKDHLGSAHELIDGSGNLVWQGNYNSFGEVTETVSSIENNLRFPGQYEDRESGLYYNYFRDYDPSTGRYITSDPIGLAGGLNTYAYVVNNPLNFVDPLGLAPPNDIPPGTSVSSNINEARNMSYIQWYNAVRNDGKWDYKQQGSQYQDFGNYNYGVTARAVGIPGNIPNRGAGWAQQQAGTSSSQWGSPWDWPQSNFGDDPADQSWINEGMRDYEYEYWDGGQCR